MICGVLYDCWWNQGTADSAIGVGMMLAVAKYFKDHNITPKCNVSFIAFAGEEYGMRGAFDYEKAHENESIIAFIDLNQLGFTQSKPRLEMKIVAGDRLFESNAESIATIIGDDSNYVQRTGDVADFRIVPYNEFPYVSDYRPFYKYRYFENKPDIFSLAKDLTWKLHHRDGLNHNAGDTMEYYNETDVEVVADLLWNLTKYYTVDSNCWFDGDVTYEAVDSSNDVDNVNDSIKANMSIKTSIPSDLVMVKAKLYQSGYSTPRLIKNIDYVVTSSGLEAELTVTLPPNADDGYYRLQLQLYNSTGRINEIVGISDNSNDSDAYYSWFPLSPRGTRQPSIPDWPNEYENRIIIQILQEYFYNTTTTDEDGDQVQYRWAWRADKLLPENQEWILVETPYGSGEVCITPHTYRRLGDKTIKVQAREHYGYMYDSSVWGDYGEWTDWSDGLDVTVKLFAGFGLSATPRISADPLMTVVDQSTQFYGYAFGGSEPYNWSWNFAASKGACNQTSYKQDPVIVFNSSDDYTVTLKVTDNDNNMANFSLVVNAADIKADFNKSIQNIGKPFEPIYFNDTSLTSDNRTITEWSWDFGDENITYIHWNISSDQNPNHTFIDVGKYNVTLTVTDNESNNDTYYEIIEITYDYTPPLVNSVSYDFKDLKTEFEVIIGADVKDSESGVKNVTVNVTYPNNKNGNFTMVNAINDTYYYVFNDTWKSGEYHYHIWTIDNENNSNVSEEYVFSFPSVFGNVEEGNTSQNVEDRITGSVFIANEYGTADSITRVHPDYEWVSTPPGSPRMKCMIFRANDSQLIGTTEEKIGMASTFNFSDPKPVLIKDTEYILTVWGNNSNARVYYDEVKDERGRYFNLTYNSTNLPNPIPWVNESRLYSIYCSYTPDTTPPEINNVSDTPDAVGFGFNVDITADVTDSESGMGTVRVNVTYPDSTYSNFTMLNLGAGDTSYKKPFSDTWQTGQYNYTIWAIDDYGNSNTSTNHSFNVSAQANISICTIKDTYGASEYINITDPPGDPSDIGYELLDGGDVLHVWNMFDSYYFNTSSGIQLTNHYDEYWSHNVIMLGYYNEGEWNLMYRTDDLTGFNKDVDSDNETYVNATLWKDLSYGGYDFRLALRYHLKINDNDLTIIPYIKNLGIAIPFDIGFGWEMKDIRIANVTGDNYLQIYNGTDFENILLNQSLDRSFTDMDFNTTINFICDNPPTFHLSRNLYLSWDRNLTYKVTVKSRNGQVNAPTTLFIKVGTLDVGQEKSTKMNWLDSDDWLGITSTKYHSHCGDTFNHDLTEALDGTDGWQHNVEHRHWFILDLGQTYTIKSVRGRSNMLSDPSDVDIYVSDDIFDWGTAVATGISTWQDNGATWNTVNTVDKDGRYIKVEIIDTEGVLQYISFGDTRSPMTIFDAYGDVAASNNAPTITSPYPANQSTGIEINPTLNITINDADGDSMDITWYSNSSGSWTSFGTNNSVGNGTYYQTFSNASVNGQWWYWKVNVSDGTNTTESSVYKFYTGVQSKIVNSGSTNISGYLYMVVEYKNGSTWELDNDTINETTPRTINASDTLALDLIFNGEINTDDFTHGDGTYRIYAAFRDPDGDVLVCDDATKLEAWWEFEVDTS